MPPKLLWTVKRTKIDLTHIHLTSSNRLRMTIVQDCEVGVISANDSDRILSADDDSSPTSMTSPRLFNKSSSSSSSSTTSSNDSEALLGRVLAGQNQSLPMFHYQSNVILFCAFLVQSFIGFEFENRQHNLIFY